jgi:hypothetical protein
VLISLQVGGITRLVFASTERYRDVLKQQTIALKKLSYDTLRTAFGSALDGDEHSHSVFNVVVDNTFQAVGLTLASESVAQAAVSLLTNKRQDLLEYWTDPLCAENQDLHLLGGVFYQSMVLRQLPRGGTFALYSVDPRTCKVNESTSQLVTIPPMEPNDVRKTPDTILTKGFWQRLSLDRY